MYYVVISDVPAEMYLVYIQINVLLLTSHDVKHEFMLYKLLIVWMIIITATVQLIRLNSFYNTNEVLAFPNLYVCYNTYSEKPLCYCNKVPRIIWRWQLVQVIIGCHGRSYRLIHVFCMYVRAIRLKRGLYMMHLYIVLLHNDGGSRLV